MTFSEHDPVRTLSRGLEQLADLLAQVGSEDLDRSTPCREWTVQQLVDHLVADLDNFTATLRGEQPDWTAAPQVVGDDREAVFRRKAADLIALWHQQDESGAGQADGSSAEVAVHTWDLCRGIGVPSDDLAPEVAERGLAFMQANLEPEMRGAMFAEEQQAPDGASPYDRIAAFAGRVV